MNIHETTVHTRCPYAPVWAYYAVTIRTNQFIKTEDIQAICDSFRGNEITQEDLADLLEASLPKHTSFTIEGRHGQNGKLTITR